MDGSYTCHKCQGDFINMPGPSAAGFCEQCQRIAELEADNDALRMDVTTNQTSHGACREIEEELRNEILRLEGLVATETSTEIERLKAMLLTDVQREEIDEWHTGWAEMYKVGSGHYDAVFAKLDQQATEAE